MEASITFDTFFWGILIRPQLTATASATAACEPASAVFVLPVAWSCRTPSGASASEDCELFYSDTFDDDPNCVEGDYKYIIVDADTLATEVACHDAMPAGELPQIHSR